VNLSRGAVVDYDALAAKLWARELSGAVLDVFPEEPLPPGHRLWTTPNVILTPHTSGFRHGHWDEVIDVFSDNLCRYQAGEPLRFEVTAARGY
jgi:phosphoglycerate dehydrogenase-like enzyme